MNILIVRLGALGDVVHAVPAVAALRAAHPSATIDWLVEARHRALVDLVTVVDRVVPLESGTLPAWLDAARRLRASRYDVAIDLQGLMKSAVLSRMSGAARVLGFSIWHLREKGARPFYSETGDAARGEPEPHVITKNLRLLRALGVADETVRFPLARVESRALATVRAEAGDRPIALINPGAAWPNKRWPPARFGEVAAFLHGVRGMHPVVLWGPGEAPLAESIAELSNRAARPAPPTSLGDLVELARASALMVSGDTGPLHIATAVGTPTVAIFGPTNPARNGPWAPDDVSVSRFEGCECHYARRCRRRDRWCLEDITVVEMTAAIQRRLASTTGRLPPSPEPGSR